MPRRNVSYRPVRYFLRRTNINSTRSKDQSNVKESTNCLQAQNESSQGHNKPGNSYPINNILVLPQNSEALINVISPNNKNFSFKKVLRKLNNRKRKEKQRLKKAQAKKDIKPDITKMKLKMNKKKPTINRHTIILSDSEDEGIKSEPKNSSTDKSFDDDVILVEVNRENEVIEIEDSCNDDLSNSKSVGANSSQYKTTERNELLSTPESSTSNDFLDNSNANINSNFNFSLHGSEFKDSEFLKPSGPVDVSESGSVSSISDIGSSIKANVFNLVDFPKERENLFDENNLDKFKDSITPQRNSSKNNVSPASSKAERRNLPTLSDIQSDEAPGQPRRERGRSIIRELVNDRAYVLLASAEKKIKKKRKSRDEAENSTVDVEVGENVSSDSVKKKKKRKKKKDDEVNSDNNCQFTEESSNISSPSKGMSENKKEKNRKGETANEDTNQEFSLAVRNDLFPEMETDTSVHSKKAKKKDKEISLVEGVEHKKKHKKHKKHVEELPEDLDTSRKRKKEKSLSECSANEYDGGKQKSKKKKRKTLDSDENSYLLITDDCDTTIDKIEVSEVNEIVTPLIKHQKKTVDPENTNNNTVIDNIPETNTQVTITENANDEKSRIIQITDIPASDEKTIIQVDLNKDTARLERSETLDKTVILDSQTVLILNELPEPNIDSKDDIENLGEGIVVEKSNFNRTEQAQDPAPQSISNLDKGNEGGKKNDAESQNDKTQSVWNMCSSNFFASSESLFVVPDVRTFTEVENKSENHETLTNTTIDTITCANLSNPTSATLFNVATEKVIVSESKSLPESNKDTNTSQLPLESSGNSEVSKSPLNEAAGNHCELKQTQNSNTLQNIDESAKSIHVNDVNVLVEVKEEKIDDNLETQVSHPNNEVNPASQIPENHSVPPTEEIAVKNEPVEITTDISKENRVTVVRSSFLGEDLAEKNLHISPEVIKNIIEEKDNIKSVTKLCEFLEGAKDSNEVLKKVSMIKQAFLAESISSDTNSLDVTSKDDDVLSISDYSDSSSVMCMENDAPILDIEDDISLANCQLNPRIETPADEPQAISIVQSVGLGKDSNDKLEDTVIDATPQDIPTSNILRCGEAGNYARNLDRYEVETIQRNMKSDSKLWKISSDDLPSNRRPVRGKRCIKCKEIGHLVMHCPNKDAIPKCYICGLEGHLEFRCPNKICTKCGTKSAHMQSYCEHCRHYGRLQCSLCSMRGHPRNKCPDLWRRYHLTVDSGPLVQADGMKLKDKEDLWCSACSKRGHLEYYCYIAMKSRSFQPLDPRIHHYEDVYKPKSDMVKSTSSGGVISKKALDEIQKYLDTPPKKTKIHPNVEPKTKELPHEKPEAPIENPTQAASLATGGFEDLPPDFVVVDEVITDPIQQILSESEKIPIINDSVRIDGPINSSQCELKQSLNSSVDNSKISEDIPRTDQDNENLDTNTEHNPFESLREYVAISWRWQNYSTASLFIPDFDMQDFFRNSDVGLLKKFLSKELKFLENIPVKIKDIFFKFHAYTSDSAKPIERREISPMKHLQFQKQLNMVLFGREHLKGCKIYVTKLQSFVDTTTGFFTDAMRESLYLAYDYIFSEKKHPHAQYIYLLKMLMNKHGYKKNNG